MNLQAVTSAESSTEEALKKLFTALYPQLRSLARCYYSSAPSSAKGHPTTKPTSLVHEAYLRIKLRSEAQWESEAHFLASVGLVIRQLLVDRARQYGAAKRGGGKIPLQIEGLPAAIEPLTPDNLETCLALEEALGRLQAIDRRQAQIVKYRFYSGLSINEVASLLKISTNTVDRDWAVAKRWLRRQLRTDEQPSRQTGGDR